MLIARIRTTEVIDLQKALAVSTFAERRFDLPESKLSLRQRRSIILCSQSIKLLFHLGKGRCIFRIVVDAPHFIGISLKIK